MRKSALCIALFLASFGMAFAQKSNVNKASNLLIAEPIDYEQARSLIAQAKEDPTTANDAKTWYVAGRIGYQQAYAQRNMWYLGQPIDAVVAGQGLTEMYENYVVADELDGLPNEKGKIKRVQRKKMMGDFKDLLDFYTITGSYLYQEGNYKEAYTTFLEYAKVVDLPMFNEDPSNSIKVDSTYNQMKYFAALAALQVQMIDEAIAVLEEVKESDFSDNATVYVYLSDQYLIQKADTAKYLELMNEAVSRYPQSAELIGTLVNFYVNSGDYAKALEYMDDLLATDPKNKEYIGVKAELYTQQAEYENAKQILLECLNNYPDDPTLTFLLGRTWAFEGTDIHDEASYLDDASEYNAALLKANECFVTALEYFEKAKLVFDKNDSRYGDMLQNMKVLYHRLQNTDKYNEIDAEIKNMY